MLIQPCDSKTGDRQKGEQIQVVQISYIRNNKKPPAKYRIQNPDQYPGCHGKQHVLKRTLYFFTCLSHKNSSLL